VNAIENTRDTSPSGIPTWESPKVLEALTPLFKILRTENTVLSMRVDLARFFRKECVLPLSDKYPFSLDTSAPIDVKQHSRNKGRLIRRWAEGRFPAVIREVPKAPKKAPVAKERKKEDLVAYIQKLTDKPLTKECKELQSLLMFVINNEDIIRELEQFKTSAYAM
jgi:hypothetical protein